MPQMSPKARMRTGPADGRLAGHVLDDLALGAGALEAGYECFAHGASFSCSSISAL